MSQHKGVSVAEKRALLEAAGEEWPLCKCHGKPKLWQKNTARKAGGFWGCRVKQNAAALRHYEANREKWQQRHRRYREENGEKCRERNRERMRRTRGWYSEGGMATEPLNVSPL